ncbi:cytosolic protein [Virgibacillus sp. 6R]|uniref:cytosolic protein n=1 Tax=Metabacillus sp. 22489 TaxID=3453928 RepID=UPI0011A5D4B6
MYVGRDMTELSMMSKKEWEDSELAYFHHSLQQVVPYLNAEGQTIHREIIEEITSRGGLNHKQATYTQGTKPQYD